MSCKVWKVCGVLVLCTVTVLLCFTQLPQELLAQQPGPSGEESEPNNSFGDANLMAAPGQVRGRISPAGDEDWYTFSVGQQGELQFTVTGVASDFAIAVRVWNSERDPMTDWFRPLAKGSDTTGVIDLAAPGRYSLEVAANEGGATSEQPYTLQLAFTAAADPFEPNNAFGPAALLTVGQPVQAYILPAGDVDWYDVAVDHQGELQVAITKVPPKMAINVRIWNANKEYISGWFAPLAKGGDTTAVLDLPAAGHYFLEVAADAGDARSTQPYTLQATFTPAADSSEPNNMFGQATSLPFDKPLQANILPKGDEDWYTIQADGQSEVRVAITKVPPDMDIGLRFWSANRDPLTDWFRPLAKGGDTNGTIDLPAAGRYLLEVAAGNGEERSVQPYTISAAFSRITDALEPNNSFGTAGDFGINREVQANIFPRGDADFYSVEVPHQGELRVTTAGVPPELTIGIRVWNPNKEPISDWYMPLAKGGPTTAAIDLARAWRYVLEVRDADGNARSLLPYTLKAEFTATADQGEPNDAIETATPAQLNQTIAANILPLGDRDFYGFDVPAPGQLNILITHVAPELDIDARVWNSAKQPITDWIAPLAKGGDTSGTVDLKEPGHYYLEVSDGASDARSTQPYLLYLSMGPIDASKVTMPAAITPGTGITTTTGITGTTGVTGTGVLTTTGPAHILTSGQIGPLGGQLFVQGTDNPAMDGARLKVLPDSLATLVTVNVGTLDTPPLQSPFGLSPAGVYWQLQPTGLQFTHPVTITLPLPAGVTTDTQFFVGHWSGKAWEDLGGIIEHGLISAQTSHFSDFGVFCGNLQDYRPVHFTQNSSSPQITLTYIGGPAPDPQDPGPDNRASCPIQASDPHQWDMKHSDVTAMLLWPGLYHFLVSYPTPQPGVANSMFVSITPGEKPVTIQIKDDGAGSDDSGIQINFPGKSETPNTKHRPQLACNAKVPAGVLVVSTDPAAPALPARRMRVGPVKLEQFPTKGPGVQFVATVKDPQGGDVRPFWTVRQVGTSTIGETPVASGSTFNNEFQFRPTTAGTYVVFVTVYNEFNLFDECRWDVLVIANAKPQLKVFSGRTHVEFGRLDAARATAGPVPALPVVGLPVNLSVPSLITVGVAVAVPNMTTCPTAVVGPFTQPPDPWALVSPPAPVDTRLPAVGLDTTNRWPFPGRTCVWAAPSDADGDLLNVRWEFPSVYYGEGTFYNVITVPVGFHPDAPEGIPAQTLLTTYKQLNAYNALLSSLYNLYGMVPAVLWESWDDPCPVSTENPCNTALSGGGVTNVIADATDSFSPEVTGYAAIGVGPEAFQPGCDSVFFISSLTPVPAFPAEGQDVIATARLSPVTEACPVDMSIVGTDGFNRRLIIPSNKDGESSLLIPGAKAGVWDVVTAIVNTPNGQLRMDVSYMFGP